MSRLSPVVYPMESRDIEEGFSVIAGSTSIDQTIDSPVKLKSDDLLISKDESIFEDVLLQADHEVIMHVDAPVPRRPPSLPSPKGAKTLASLWSHFSLNTVSNDPSTFRTGVEQEDSSTTVLGSLSTTPTTLTRRLYSRDRIPYAGTNIGRFKGLEINNGSSLDLDDNEGEGGARGSREVTISSRYWSGFLSNLKPYFFEQLDGANEEGEDEDGEKDNSFGFEKEDAVTRSNSRSRSRSSHYQLITGEEINTATKQTKASASVNLYYYSEVRDFDAFEQKLMSNIHYGPLIVLTAIHLRLIFNDNIIQLASTGNSHYPSNDNNHQLLIGLFVSFVIISMITLWFSFYLRFVFHWKTMSRQAMENVVIFVMSLCFALLLILVTVDDYLTDHALSTSPSASTSYSSSSSFHSLSFRYELSFYMMMIPFILNISLSRVSSVVNYLSWSLVCFSAIISFSISSSYSHSEQSEADLANPAKSIPFFVAIIVVSLFILVAKRKSKAAMIQVYRQVEEMKALHNKLSDDLVVMQKELKEQRHLLANTAHDLKMPIAATISGCEVLRDTLKDLAPVIPDCASTDSSAAVSTAITAIPMMSGVIEEILNTNQFMLVSINRCMEYAKVCDGVKLVPKLETCQIIQSLRVVMNCCHQSPSISSASSSPSAGSKTKIESTIANDVCSHIITDKHWFQENLLCLLSNAMKFTPYGKIDIRLSLLKPPAGPTIAAQQGKNIKQQPMLLVEVEDSGIGIPQHLRLSLFEPFKQAQQHAGGTGLGLYSLSRRVQALGGEYGVTDRVDHGQGSRFWFTFPYRPDAVSAEILAEEMAPNTMGSRSIRQEKVVANTMNNDEKSNDSTLLPLSLSFPVLPTLYASSPSVLSSPQPQLTARVASPSIIRGASSQIPESPSSYVKRSFLVSGGNTTINRQPTLSPNTTTRKRFTQDTDDGGAVAESKSDNNIAVVPSTTITSVPLLPVPHPPKYQILLVDDSASMLKISSMILSRVGHTVTKAENGLEALMVLEEADAQRNAATCFDVMIIDLHMPVMDGVEAIRRLRAKEAETVKLKKMSFDLSVAQGAIGNGGEVTLVEAIGSMSSSSRTSSRSGGQQIDMKKGGIHRQETNTENESDKEKDRRKIFPLIVIACSANDDEETVQETRDAGADAFLTKPYTAVQFMDLMKVLVAERLTADLQ